MWSVIGFFFKQKTAYEIEYGLVGSEMCIRDRDIPAAHLPGQSPPISPRTLPALAGKNPGAPKAIPVSYTHLTLPTSDLV